MMAQEAKGQGRQGEAGWSGTDQMQGYSLSLKMRKITKENKVTIEHKKFFAQI